MSPVLAGSNLPGLAELDALRRGSEQQEELALLGRQTFLRSPGALDEGDALRLNATATGPREAREFEWGMYDYHPVWGSLIDAEVQLDVVGSSEAWVMLSNYFSQRWELHGPYTESAIIPVSNDYLSGDYVFYCTVVAAVGNNARVNAVLVHNLVPDYPPPVLVDDEGAATGWDPSLAVVAGVPAIAYHANVTGIFDSDLRFARASSADGSSWNQHVVVDAFGDTGLWPSLAEVNGHPAISYYNATSRDLCYIRALDPAGDTWGQPQFLQTEGVIGEFSSLRVVNGRPAIAFFDRSNADLCYIRASDSDGLAWSEVYRPDAGVHTGYFPSLEIVNGVPAISYKDAGQHSLMFVRALDLDGTTWAAPIEVDTDEYTGGAEITSLEIVDGHPAISYTWRAQEELCYVRALDPDGSVWGLPLVIDQGESYFSLSNSMAVINGKPRVAYSLDYGHMVAHNSSIDQAGAGWNGRSTLERLHGHGTGNSVSLAEVNANSAMAFCDSGSLYYMREF